MAQTSPGARCQECTGNGGLRSRAAKRATTPAIVGTLAGLVAFGLDRPHETGAAGAVVIAAGAYELTPVKGHFRRRCREETGSGLTFRLCCIGSTAGLMAILVALGMMSLFWMAIVAVLATAQKLLPAKPAIDIPLAGT